MITPVLNNAAIVEVIGRNLDSTPARRRVRRRVTSDPCLPERLPSSAFLLREAESVAPNEILRQLRRSPSPPSSPPAEDDDDFTHLRSSSVRSTASASVQAKAKSKVTDTQCFGGPWKEPQPFEVFRAVERKDIMYLMEIRDRAFHLLLRKSGDATPLLHAMRIGQSHKDVAIILLGAFSRWVNHLDEADIQKPKTKALLKALRTNLKLAIDYGLAQSQSDLTASFLQTLIMSEGDKWVWAQVSNVSLALKAGTTGEPVKAASSAVRKFATKELGKAALIASLEDYVANATVDLLMMAAWSSSLDTIPGEQIPTYFFARDDRVFKCFTEQLDEHAGAIRHALSKRLKWQLRVLQVVIETRTTSYRRKVELLSGELDCGEGV
ncbi:uncharacterized protein BT62DRAFT_945391 [Guyanagaster necrorhizus]|uniref:Uncharacterized protein n=1 Tax=Guyanagaster necrorhizus TaxID=856835 RepID=A0A9P8AVG0_9AGAR|nr:uncharacterized protein BT62DRAFT_945391 [Guyanagaster necrorhizus MCA 3950]KAG7449270.1 hypothetical protein BT62DRAFT_945391 [Guyanagaster necrorhizus MCA 3950]